MQRKTLKSLNKVIKKEATEQFPLRFMYKKCLMFIYVGWLFHCNTPCYISRFPQNWERYGTNFKSKKVITIKGIAFPVK